jgi:hypothetical protein
MHINKYNIYNYLEMNLKIIFKYKISMSNIYLIMFLKFIGLL